MKASYSSCFPPAVHAIFVSLLWCTTLIVYDDRIYTVSVILSLMLLPILAKITRFTYKGEDDFPDFFEQVVKYIQRFSLTIIICYNLYTFANAEYQLGLPVIKDKLDELFMTFFAYAFPVVEYITE